MNRSTEVTIIGGGVLGVSLAYHLSLRNIPCIVIEREPFSAAHASGKNAGMLRHLYRNSQLSEWAKITSSEMPEEIRALHFKQTASLIVGRELPGHHPELFEAREYKGIPSVYSPLDGLLDSPSYVAALQSLARKQGAEFIFREKISELSHDGEKWTATSDTQLSVKSTFVVNAAGAWVNGFLTSDSTVSKSNVDAFARHLFVVEGWEKNYMPEKDCGFFWDERNQWYMRHWDEATKLVSVCDQTACVPEEFKPKPEVLIEVSERLLEELPEVADRLRVGRSWHCFRTYTEDKLPIWGFDEEAKNFFWLAGFGGFGMSTSFGATKDAAKALAEPTIHSGGIAEFSPKRTKMVRT